MEIFIIIIIILLFTTIIYNLNIEWHKVSTIEKNNKNEREINIIEATSRSKIKEDESTSQNKRADSEQQFYQNKLNENTESINKLVDIIVKQYEISNELQIHATNTVIQPSLSKEVYTRMEVMRFCKNDMDVKTDKELYKCIRQTVSGEFFDEDGIKQYEDINVVIINNEGNEIVKYEK